MTCFDPKLAICQYDYICWRYLEGLGNYVNETATCQYDYIFWRYLEGLDNYVNEKATCLINTFPFVLRLFNAHRVFTCVIQPALWGIKRSRGRTDGNKNMGILATKPRIVKQTIYKPITNIFIVLHRHGSNGHLYQNHSKSKS